MSSVTIDIEGPDGVTTIITPDIAPTTILVNPILTDGIIDSLLVRSAGGVLFRMTWNDDGSPQITAL